MPPIYGSSADPNRSVLLRLDHDVQVDVRRHGDTVHGDALPFPSGQFPSGGWTMLQFVCHCQYTALRRKAQLHLTFILRRDSSAAARQGRGGHGDEDKQCKDAQAERRGETFLPAPKCFTAHLDPPADKQRLQ